MKKKKLKSINYESNDTKEIKSLIIITIVVIAIAVGLFFLTNYLNNKKATSNINIDYDTCIVGNMFNRPYNEYYVFLYSSTDKNASTYKGLITSYKDKDDALKVYYVDMNDKFNSAYLSETSNKKPTESSEVKINESALILIKDGKVEKYYESLEDIDVTLINVSTLSSFKALIGTISLKSYNSL